LEEKKMSISEDCLSGNLYQNTANFYDFDNREIIKDDLEFYTEYVKQVKGPILELASGTGRVSLYIAEKTGRTIECVELSAEMRGRFTEKLQTTHQHLRQFIHLHDGDMSNFDLGQKFELIIIPWRALQWLPVQEKTIDCLKCVYRHLADNGIFVFDIFRPRTYDEKWIGREDVSYDIVVGNKRIIRSTINHFADTEKKYIQYKNKIRILENDIETVKEDMLTIKYYEYDDIIDILRSLHFNVKEEYGYYDKRSPKDGEEMIFVCTKY
jgi:SAM-dependent methyltransferase